MARLQRDFERLAGAVEGALTLRDILPTAQLPAMQPPPKAGELFGEINADAEARLVLQTDLRPRLRSWWPVGWQNL